MAMRRICACHLPLHVCSIRKVGARECLARRCLADQLRPTVPTWLSHIRAMKGETISQAESRMTEAYVESLKNYETKGVPAGAGIHSKDGFELARVHRLMTRLGDPIVNYKVVHIAGSKGKGSTVAFLSEILRAAGLRVGTYTSPHVRELQERIQGPTGQPIMRSTLDDLVARHRKVIDQVQQEEGGRLTHFEVLTALAYTHFAEERVDLAVIETGLGGLRDATNVVPRASLAAAVITSLGWEHVEALGGSLESIARAKAGIMKEGCPLVLAQQTEPVAEAVIRAEAAQLATPVIAAAPPLVQWRSRGNMAEPSGVYELCDLTVSADAAAAVAGAVHGGPREAKGNTVHEDTGKQEAVQLQQVRLGLVGPHQLRNAAGALLAALILRAQGWGISDSALRQGLEKARLPGRFQVLSSEEKTRLGVGEAAVVLDGAHTAASAAALASTLKAVFPSWPMVVVVAMASDKDHVAFASALLQGIQPEAIICTQVPIAGSASRSTPAADILQAFETAVQSQAAGSRWQGELRAEARVDVAVREAAGRLSGAEQGHKSVLCVTGSLHAVGAVLSLVER